MIAAQRRRRPVDELIERTPADGMIGGIGTVNGDLFEGHAAQVIAVSYDYTVLAGTQGQQNHRKKDRLFEPSPNRCGCRWCSSPRAAAGGPATPMLSASAARLLGVPTLRRLSGLVPLVGINAGYCFAGNAAVLGCCDVVIATEDSNIGMGGPAMIEGGGLGVFRPRRDRPDERPTVQRRGRHRRRRRSRGGRRRQAVPLVLPGLARPLGVRRSARAAPRDPRESRARLRRARGDRHPVRRGSRCSSCANTSASAWSRRSPHRGPARRRRRQQPHAPRRRDRQRRRRQGARASCSCATRSTSPSSRWSTRRG